MYCVDGASGNMLSISKKKLAILSSNPVCCIDRPSGIKAAIKKITDKLIDSKASSTVIVLQINKIAQPKTEATWIGSQPKVVEARRERRRAHGRGWCCYRPTFHVLRRQRSCDLTVDAERGVAPALDPGSLADDVSSRPVPIALLGDDAQHRWQRGMDVGCGHWWRYAPPLQANVWAFGRGSSPSVDMSVTLYL